VSVTFNILRFKVFSLSTLPSGPSAVMLWNYIAIF